MSEPTKLNLSGIELQIQEAIDSFKQICSDSGDTLIYMPDYFNRIFTESVYKRVLIEPITFNIRKGKTYSGCEIIDGYDNCIIVAVRDGALQDVPPIRIEIP